MKRQNNKIGIELRIKRRKAGLTQYQVAGMTGIPRIDITRYETGASMPPAHKYLLILDAINNFLPASGAQ